MNIIPMSGNTISVEYHRCKNTSRRWEHRLLADMDGVIVSSFLYHLEEPFSPLGTPLIHTGYHGVLYDPLGELYNVIRVTDTTGVLVGYYCDIRTLPERTEEGYQALDLILDIWVSPGGDYHVLDQDEFQEAELPDELEKKALSTLEELKSLLDRGDFPPPWFRDIRRKISPLEI